MFVVCFHSYHDFLFLKFATLASVNSDFSHPLRASYFKPTMNVVLSSVNTVLNTSRVQSWQLRIFKEVSKSRNGVGGVYWKTDAPSSVSDLWPYIGKRLVLQEEVVWMKNEIYGPEFYFQFSFFSLLMHCWYAEQIYVKLGDTYVPSFSLGVEF